MLQNDGRDYLYLIWKAERTRKQHIIGKLSKNGQYEFRYYKEVDAAISDGFELLISFPDRCDKALKIEKGEKVYLKNEPENENDKYAVEAHTKNGDKLGYIPRYYSEAVSTMLSNNRNVECEVFSINRSECCHECIKVFLNAL